MKLVWHIAKKDLRRMALPAALWVAFVVGATIWFRTASPGENVHSGEVITGWLPMMNVWAKLFTVAQFVIGYLLVGALVLEDPVIGADAFWLTRPIANARLLLAKTLSVALLFLGAPAVALGVVWLSCGFSVQEVWQATSELGMHLGLVAVVALTLASLSRNLVQFLFSSFGLAILTWAVLAIVVLSLSPRERLEPFASHSLLVTLFLGCGALLVPVWSFLSRKRIGGWLVPLLAACCAIGVASPRFQWGIPAGAPAANALPPELQGSIVTKGVSLVHYPERGTMLGETKPTERPRVLQMEATIVVAPERATAGLWFAPHGTAVLTWDSGTPPCSMQLSWSGGSWTRDSALGYLQGRVDPSPITFHLSGSTGAQRQPPPGEARIAGKWEIWSGKIRMMGELPMMVGGELTADGSRSRVLAVESSIGWNKTLVVEERELNVDATFDGQIRANWFDVFALFNRQTKDALIVTHNDLGLAELNGEVIVLRRLFVPEVRAGEEWRRDAVLVKLRLEPVGRFTVPFEARAKVKVIEEER